MGCWPRQIDNSSTSIFAYYTAGYTITEDGHNGHSTDDHHATQRNCVVAALVLLYRASRCFALEKSRPDYTVYHNLSAVYAEVAALAETYPTYVQVDHRFKSGNGLSQLVVRLANFSDSTLHSAPQLRSYKVRALLLFGQRGGELVTVESALHFLRQLFNGLSAPSHTVEGAVSRKLLSKVDLHLIVLVNPDGFNHAERTGDYCFDKTASGAKMSSLFVWDLDKHLNAEPETHVLLNLSRAQPYDAFVAFHSGSREIHLPYAGGSLADVLVGSGVGRFISLQTLVSWHPLYTSVWEWSASPFQNIDGIG
ncbi:hypothetical protein HPB51_026431 [Rhipicephalus microplus]|uniref:Peptidase M14 domain-containing protein n=1 Tax=Rhipicephalus microplus TaxID=6941 RepID=A0A9J6D344_RHIMP|nr:hypothetical protein HPB51_026431 [Rhipicephalus microplus]